MLVIDPDVCIDCAVCIPECPVDAIRSEHNLEPGQEQWIKINAELSQAWPVITQKVEPLPDAANWDTVQHKIQYLDRG